MGRIAALGILISLTLPGCGGRTAAPFINAAKATSLEQFALNPSPLELTSDAPAAVITAQDDVAGVEYTAHADSACANASGSIAVAGDGIAQLDVAGSPLLFIAVAAGTPPPSCSVTVTGSDGSSARVEIDYSAVTVNPNTLVAAQAQRVTMSGASIAPATVTIATPTDVVTVDASGFSGLTKTSIICPGARGGISAIPSSFTGSGMVTIAPYGQGALSGTCTVTFTDSTSKTATLSVTLAAKALNKLTVSPNSVQFACAGSAPQTCVTENAVTIAEAGATQFRVNTRPALKGSCANVFNGPLKMTTGNGTYASSVAGPQASVTFYALLSTPQLNCAKIVIGDGTGQTVAINVNPTLATGTTVASAPACTGPDPLVAAPNAPHGMYVWNPYKVEGGKYESLIEQDVIGKKDPSFCGVSLVVPWSAVEPSKGVFKWTQIDTWAAPYVKAGLRVNLLFADAAEVGTSDTATPAWVFSQDGVGTVNCPNQVPYPNWLDPAFEADYEAFIGAAVKEFSTGGGSLYAANIGYMRFGIGAGVEAYPGHIERPPLTNGNHPCLDAWAPYGFTYAKWLQHTLNIVHALAQQHTDKQLMIALNYVPTYATNTGKDKDTYTYANAVAASAAPAGIAFGTENLGIGAVAATGAAPHACDPSQQILNLYWCQAFMRHLGKVPFEFQPIASPINPVGYNVTIAHLFQYALDNNAQVLEIYPQDWVFNDDPAAFPGFTAATQADYQAAFQATSLLLGRLR